jgi:hypothetical protein
VPVSVSAETSFRVVVKRHSVPGVLRPTESLCLVDGRAGVKPESVLMQATPRCDRDPINWIRLDEGMRKRDGRQAE